MIPFLEALPREHWIGGVSQLQISADTPFHQLQKLSCGKRSPGEFTKNADFRIPPPDSLTWQIWTRTQALLNFNQHPHVTLLPEVCDTVLGNVYTWCECYEKKSTSCLPALLFFP